MKDMTKGSVVKHLLVFALPLLLGNIFQQLYSIVDTAVLGRGVGVEALAAAGSTGSVNFFVLGFITGLTHGYSILISQSFGSGSAAATRKAVTMGAYLSAAGALVITVLSLVGSRPLLKLMGTPADLMEDALLYIRILFLGIGASVFYNYCSAVLRALGDSLSPLVIVVISSVVNCVLDILFVMVFPWGVAGAAWATVTAQLLSGFLCLFVLGRVDLLRMEKADWKPDGEVLWKLLKLGVPVGLMNSVTAIGNMILQGVVNGLGSVTVAAYTIGTRIIGLAEQPTSLLGFALGTFVGQNLGANKVSRIREGVRKTFFLSLAMSVLVGGALILFGKNLAGLFFADAAQDVIETAYPFILTTGALLPVLGWLFTYRFALQGIGDTTVPLLSGGLELLLRIAVVLFLPLSLGYWRICFAEVSAWAGAMLLLMFTYYIRVRKLERKGPSGLTLS